MTPEDFAAKLADFSFRMYAAGREGEPPPSLTELTAPINALLDQHDKTTQELLLAELTLEDLKTSGVGFPD